jgi:glycerol-3-phosphate dehydrogenase
MRSGGSVLAVDFDLAIIGGGINGSGIARDAAGRGLTVTLFEQGDLGAATSSASTKLIHGGLRYLEHYEFRLVREALQEREVLLRIAPHIIWPMRFVLPHHDGLRPAWLLRLGLYVYDHLGGRSILPGTRTLNLRNDPAGGPLKPAYRKGFEYSDCWVEDSRLVVLNARDAAEHGALVRPRMRVVSAERSAGRWRVTAQDGTGAAETIGARILVNAGGPWVGEVLRSIVRSNASSSVRLVQGSHVVVPKLWNHDHSYIFQNADGRIIFAIPYESEFTLIGTTDRDYAGDPAAAAASPAEIAYLCAAATEYFARPIAPGDVVWTYSGVRPLYDDGASKAQEATRDYVFELDAPAGAAPLLSVFGGKITTYRRLAEAALEKLTPYLPRAAAEKRGWTGHAPLPGGNFPHDGFAPLVTRLLAKHPYLEPPHARRLVRAYGTRAERLFDGITSESGLGRRLGFNLTEAEVRYLMREEWAVTAADVLWRRSRLGLRLTVEEAAALDAFMSKQRSNSADRRPAQSRAMAGTTSP